MKYSYTELKKGIHELSRLQEKEFWVSPVSGDKVALPLIDRDIGAVIYKNEPDAPVVFTCFGGGFVMGSAANDDRCWTELRDKLGVTLIAINYRKAPDNPFPAALNDIYDSIEYIESHLSEFHLNTDDFSIFGFSAGGNLATAVCLLNSERGCKLGLRRQILCYPYLDLATSPRAKGHPEDDLMMYRLFPEQYCGENDPSNPFISPLYATDKSISGLPRTIIVIAGDDPLHAEAARYAIKLRTAGVGLNYLVCPEMPHGFIETAYQEPTEYLSKKATEQLLSGDMEREKNLAFDFIKKHFREDNDD